MASVLRIPLVGADGTEAGLTHTVIGGDLLPVEPVVDYLQFLRDTESSPNTVAAYARGLAAWWTVLEHSAHTWEDFPVGMFGVFLDYLRTGDLPGVIRVGEVQEPPAKSTVALRAAAVHAFYRFHADTSGLQGPYQRLYSTRGKRGRSQYQGMLTGVGRAKDKPRPVFTVRNPAAAMTPILVPAQVRAILDGCSTWDGRRWSGSESALRDRLLFAVLVETGMRIGEALSLRHCDFHAGTGQTPWIDIEARQDHPHGERAKSGRPRRIFIGDDLESLYSAYVWQLVDRGVDLEVPDLATHFVFVNLAGGKLFEPMRVESIYSKIRSLKSRPELELPPRWSPHWLRHTHATALLLAGAPPHMVMRRLGHLDMQTTVNTYGWVTEDAELRSIGDWHNFTAGWKGLHDGHT